MDEFSELQEKYGRDVLPYIIPGASKDIIGSAGYGSGRFDLGLSSDAITGTPYDPKKNRFVHFTSLRSFQSIINDNAIRLYNLQNVNDPNELHFYAKELQITPDSVDRLKANTFILSLCDVEVLSSENSLNLWRFYGLDGWGVAIEFEIDIPISRHEGYFLGKVLYEEPKIDEFRQRNDEFEKSNGVHVDFKEIMRVPACFHKHPYYKTEEEIRLMLVSDYGDLKAKYDFKQGNFRCDFNARNELVTYHKIELGQTSPFFAQIAIKRVELGFRHSQDFFVDFKDHLMDTIVSMGKAGIWKDDLPIIEQSLLKNIFR